MSKNNLTTSDFHLPYNQKLTEVAKELRQNMTAAEKKLWHNYLKNLPLRVLSYSVSFKLKLGIILGCSRGTQTLN